jgi:hypothetical protein
MLFRTTTFISASFISNSSKKKRISKKITIKDFIKKILMIGKF